MAIRRPIGKSFQTVVQPWPTIFRPAHDGVVCHYRPVNPSSRAAKPAYLLGRRDPRTSAGGTSPDADFAPSLVGVMATRRLPCPRVPGFPYPRFRFPRGPAQQWINLNHLGVPANRTVVRKRNHHPKTPAFMVPNYLTTRRNMNSKALSEIDKSVLRSDISAQGTFESP